MRFEISYKGGTTHEVELPGSVAVLGRDPGCDVVLNDAKCSRRHAVVEEGPEGIAVRDSDSANGVFLNGRRVERALLRPGDTLRLGDVHVKLLAEVGETVVVAAEDLDLRLSEGAEPTPVGPLSEVGPPVASPPPPSSAPPTARPAPVPPARRPAPPVTSREPTAPRRRPTPPPRPATVTVLAVLWALFVPASVAAVLVLAGRTGGVLAWAVAVPASFALAGLGTTMALGLRSLAPWARHLQIAAAAIGLLVCPFTLASATVLLYASRPEVKAAFDGRQGGGTSDATFAVSLVGMLLLGLALSAIAVVWLW
jgi:pSer/pThr/pTyr-binding forkhead associated (FHA) protein